MHGKEVIRTAVAHSLRSNERSHARQRWNQAGLSAESHAELLRSGRDDVCVSNEVHVGSSIASTSGCWHPPNIKESH
jgi:hypothetical protein